MAPPRTPKAPANGAVEPTRDVGNVVDTGSNPVLDLSRQSAPEVRSHVPPVSVDMERMDSTDTPRCIEIDHGVWFSVAEADLMIRRLTLARDTVSQHRSLRGFTN